MAFIIGLYLLVDVLQHKGQTRVLFPKKYPVEAGYTGQPRSQAELVNHNKNWSKEINSISRLQELQANAAGFETDLYFDTSDNHFDVHHDLDKPTGLRLESLLEIYQRKKLTAAIWLDIKNLNREQAASALRSLIKLRTTFNLQQKILVESQQASLLSAFSDSGFYTSYYVPMFNPYRINDAALVFWADSISRAIKSTKLNALSGYYFQTDFLSHYFPAYPVLTWIENDRFSLVNQVFKAKIAANKSIHIVLKP